MQIRTLVAAASFLAAMQPALATDYDELARELRTTRDPNVMRQMLEKAGVDVQSNANRPWVGSAESIRSEVRLRQMATGTSGRAGDNGNIRSIMGEIGFDDRAPGSASNWLSDALRRALTRPERPDDIKPPAQAALPDTSVFSKVVLWIAWSLLVFAFVAFMIFAARSFAARKRQLRRSAVMADSEPDRTVDEWLGLADKHAQAGEFREAVRALYLACLLQLDQANVARFIRSETNWEHLRRIEDGGRMPPGLEFRPPTKAFDTIWYGRRVEGVVDVERFRAWYLELKGALAAK